MKIDHIGIATNDIAQATQWWRDAIGLNFDEIEEVVEQKVRVAKTPLGDTSIELLEPASADSPISKFLDKRGPGIHHIAVRVDDIHAALAEMKEKGVRLIDEQPRVGAGGCLVAFVHPSSTGGVLLELVQNPDQSGLQA